MGATKCACVTLAEFRVIAAPAFGDIVEEGCDIDQPWLGTQALYRDVNKT